MAMIALDTFSGLQTLRVHFHRLYGWTTARTPARLARRITEELQRHHNVTYFRVLTMGKWKEKVEIDLESYYQSSGPMVSSSMLHITCVRRVALRLTW